MTNQKPTKFPCFTWALRLAMPEENKMNLLKNPTPEMQALRASLDAELADFMRKNKL